MLLHLKIKLRSLLGEEYLLIEADMFLINCCISTLGNFGFNCNWYFADLGDFENVWDCDVLLPMTFSVF